jgi:hypothetical protein
MPLGASFFERSSLLPARRSGRLQSLHSELGSAEVDDGGTEIILERAKELQPRSGPRIISDNGPQFIAKDFKEFIRVSGIPMSRGASQRCPPEQCHWLHHAEGHARQPSAGDPRGARPEVGGCAEAAADSPPASRLTLNLRWTLVLDTLTRPRAIALKLF